MGLEIEMYCECGAEPEIDEEKSNDNWTVFKTECNKCGERLKIRTVEK